MAKLRSAKIFKQPFSTMNKNKPFKKKKTKTIRRLHVRFTTNKKKKKNEEQK